MPATSYVSPPSSPLSHHKPSISSLTRNIDQVLLGSILFDTWYYSPYPDSIILGSEKQPKASAASTTATNTASIGRRDSAENASHNVKSEDESGAITTRGTRKSCPRLHVCPRCFAYTPNSLHYIIHLKHHCLLRAPTASSKTSREAKSPGPAAENDGSGGVPRSATKVYDYEGYAVWEVDGELEKLYCQNLSLFGKLFLEQKSVFFDVSGFHYYVLTYTPPEGTSVVDTPAQDDKKGKGGAARGSRKRKAPDTSPNDTPEDYIHDLHTGPQTLGFFSKEKLSWDSNNLACIVIFPPYQHRSLGQLLMSVSYKLSGWEWEGGVIGGPEKPLSTMGKKSYTRFWEERIARYLLGESRDADGRRMLERANKSKKKRKRNGTAPTSAKDMKKKKKELFTVKDLGDRTGMLAEDVVVALIGMGVCDKVTRRGVSKKSAAASTTTTTTTGSSSAAPPAKKTGPVNGETNHAPNTRHHHHPPAQTSAAAAVNEASRSSNPASIVIKHAKVLAWAAQHGIEIKDPVPEEGFVGEWALSDLSDEEDEEDADEEDEDGGGDVDMDEDEE